MVIYRGVIHQVYLSQGRNPPINQSHAKTMKETQEESQEMMNNDANDTPVLISLTQDELFPTISTDYEAPTTEVRAMDDNESRWTDRYLRTGG